MSTFFDFTLSDSQGTSVRPIRAEDFDIEAYADYAAEKDEVCGSFAARRSGILVYRRFRVPEVFAAACGDMKLSLSLQLAALEASRAYATDVPNFLEPWYGIGTVAAAYGADYIWNGDLAPAVKPLFTSVDEALSFEPRPIASTPVGRRTLDMVEYFLDATQGKIPMSFSDVQSPLNAALSLVDTSEFLVIALDEPDKIAELLDRAASLSIEFFRKQADMIGDAVVRPGHGFASSRRFAGLGVSDDNSVMISPDLYAKICSSAMEKFGKEFGGIVFHSCGDWSARIPVVKALGGLVAVDGAFTLATDPEPNPPSPFRDAFRGTGVCVNARMVGDPQVVLDTAKNLWAPDMKMIVVTYGRNPEEQKYLYEAIHEIAQS